MKIAYKSYDQDEWRKAGGLEDAIDRKKLEEEVEEEDDGKSFHYQFSYDHRHGRFESPREETADMFDNARRCPSCHHGNLVKSREFAQLGSKSDAGSGGGYLNVRWREMDVKVGDAVFLEPLAFQFKSDDVAIKAEKKSLEDACGDGESAGPDGYDEDKYPEKYRKTETIKGSNLDTPQPFCIGYVSSIGCAGIVSRKLSPSDVRLKVVKLYRPGDTHYGAEGAFRGDWHLVYWSRETVTVELAQVAG